MRISTALLVFSLAAWLPLQAAAATVHFTATMDGPQANAGAGTGSPGIGFATMSLNTDTNFFTWNITWSGLLGTPTLMHFHGPALPNQNAGVQIGTGVAGPPVIGNAIINASQEADLLAGLWYLNLHTTAFGGGEIRGQVLSSATGGAGVPSLAPLGLATLCTLLGLAGLRRLRG